MRLSFKQGIVNHQTDTFGTPTFLSVSGGYVSLMTTNSPTVITFTQGGKDYLYTERQSQINAWGPFSSGDVWLFWKINMVTGEREFGSTILEPAVDYNPPINPGTGQIWFNSSTNIMYEYTGSSWVESLIVFACKLQSSTTPVSMSANSPDFRGTQVGLNIEARAGELIYDILGKPIRTSNRQFFNSEDEFYAGTSTGARLRIGSSLIPSIAQQPLHKYQVVEFTDYNEILPASPFTQLSKPYGIIEEDAPTGAIVDFVTEGLIFNEDWDWINLGADVNDPVYIDETGDIQIVPYLGGQMPVGTVVGPREIMFSPRLFSHVNASISFDLSANYIGAPSDGQFIWHQPIIREMEIVDSLSTDHQGYAETAPSGGDAVFEVFTSQNGGAKVSRGTITFADGSNIVTAQNITSFSLDTGDVVHIQCVSGYSIENVSLTLKGNTIIFWK